MWAPGASEFASLALTVPGSQKTFEFSHIITGLQASYSIATRSVWSLMVLFPTFHFCLEKKFCCFRKTKHTDIRKVAHFTAKSPTLRSEKQGPTSAWSHSSQRGDPELQDPHM